MASAEECERALQQLAGQLSSSSTDSRHAEFDRTLTCTLRDLDLIYAGRLHDGTLTDITTASSPSAQIRLSMTSDDLLALVDGRLNMASAWATGRVKVGAGVRDLMRLRSIF